MNQKDKIKKRANKIFVKFKTKLSNQSLNGLVNDMRFIGKFIAVDVIKHNDNVIGIHAINQNKIDYVISIEGIEAFSLHQRDKIVKNKLEDFAKNLLEKVGRKKDDYTLDDSGRHEYIQNFDSTNLLNKNFVKNIHKIFKEKGYDEAIFQSIKILIEKEGNPIGIITIYYPDKESHKKREILIEAKANLIREVVSLIKGM